MPDNPEKTVRYVAAGYSLFAALWFVMGGTLVALFHGYSFVVTLRDAYIVNGDATVVSVLAFGVLNVVIALAAWYWLLLRNELRIAVLVVVTGIAGLFLASSAFGVVSLYSREVDVAPSWYQPGALLLITVGYVLLAWMLVRAVRMRVVTERAK